MTSSNEENDTGQDHPDNDIYELAKSAMILLRTDEDKLIKQTKELVKTNPSVAVAVFTACVDGWTPLHACALRGTKKLMKLLLHSGINANTEMGQPDGLPDKVTPLHIAAHRGDEKICELLISHGALVNSRDSFNRTPVFYASRGKHRHLVKFLQGVGADMSDIYGMSRECSQEDTVTPQQGSKFCFL